MELRNERGIDESCTFDLFVVRPGWLLFGFFFQAEDGIRDGHVTGVQTCALPISAPIQAAIRLGLVETGVTIMRMVPQLDAGPILLQARTPIVEDETYGELQLRLSELGAQALIEALARIGAGSATETPQDDARAVAQVVRAYDPRPGAFTTLRAAEVKLFGARPVPGARGDPGEVLAV